MRILAFDCAGAQCAAAVVADGRTLAAARIDAERGHASLLMPLLLELARSAGARLGDFDCFAVTTGPGSFTGIRVALAAAQGLAIATGRPVQGIPVFDVLAAGAAEAHPSAPRILIAVDSRRAECFLQLFGRDGAPLEDPVMRAPAAVAAWLGPGPVAIAGDAAAKVQPHAPEAILLGRRFDAADPAILARLAGARSPSGSPRPFYLRPPDAIPAARRRGARR